MKKYLTYMSKYSSCIDLEIHCINYSKTSQKWYTWLEMNLNHVSTLFPCYFYGWERFNCIYAHKSALLICTNLPWRAGYYLLIHVYRINVCLPGGYISGIINGRGSKKIIQKAREVVNWLDNLYVIQAKSYLNTSIMINLI